MKKNDNRLRFYKLTKKCDVTKIYMTTQIGTSSLLKFMGCSDAALFLKFFIRPLRSRLSIEIDLFCPFRYDTPSAACNFRFRSSLYLENYKKNYENDEN